jgi:glucokinase
LDRLLDLVAEVWPADGQVRAIGAGLPGPINPKTGVLFNAPNIPGWVNLPIRQHLQDRFQVPVLVGNDANLAALGEWRFGAGRGHHDLLYLTISTGIGGGVIMEDRLLLGDRGLAAELGHVTVQPDGPLCGCGKRGHLEAYASGTAIARYVSEQIAKGVPSRLSSTPNITAREVSQAAQEGDALARESITRAGTYLGIGLANFLHIFNPSRVILGGGVSRIGPMLLDPMKATLAEQVTSPEFTRSLEIVSAELGDDAGLMGALALAHTALY